MPVLALKPSDLDFSQMPDKASLGELTRISTAVFTQAIAAKLGAGMKGFISDADSKTLSDFARNAGARPSDIVESISGILSNIGTSASKIDFRSIAMSFEKTRIADLQAAITQNLGSNLRVFYLLIDDTDQVAAPGSPDHLNRIWSFLLAARNLTDKCENIRCIITLRTEIWVRLTRDEAGQRDQVDHFRPLVCHVNPVDGDVANIIERRMALAIRDANLHSDNVYQPFFDGHDLIVPGFGQRRTWHDFIVKRSRERPRDAIQLVTQLNNEAKKRKSPNITASHVEAVLPKYSEERADDLKRETEKECSYVKEIIRCFADTKFRDGNFSATSEEIRDFLKKLPSRFPIKIYGRSLTQDTAESAFRLWEFLWDVGFIHPRFDDPSQPKGYAHLTPRDLPDFVSPARWTDFQRVKWDIHPAYRDYLSTERNRFGKPSGPGRA